VSGVADISSAFRSLSIFSCRGDGARCFSEDSDLADREGSSFDSLSVKEKRIHSYIGPDWTFKGENIVTRTENLNPFPQKKIFHTRNNFNEVPLREAKFTSTRATAKNIFFSSSVKNKIEK